jgi:hypothetical protein
MWLLTTGSPVQLSSNSRMSDIDSDSADFFNDSPLFMKDLKEKNVIMNWKGTIKFGQMKFNETKTTEGEKIQFLFLCVLMFSS